MKQYILPSLKLTLVMIILCAVLYPMLISGVAKLSPGAGKGETVEVDGKVVGYKLIGQSFTADKYFWGRPSAVNYNAAGSAGSNKAASNPDYIQTVKDRIDSFLIHNPGIKKNEIPAEMVTASGSGLDPDISVKSALVQVKRIAATRQLSEDLLRNLITANSISSFVAPEKVNVLKLNIALDKLK
ncbi:MAG: potassium-transporting ATPase subunit KdpC [Gemmatimonadaceae bacterium]|nr:potassium-transporting ATPase subunit KdpC [Chitinophagaceae bacterium]